MGRIGKIYMVAIAILILFVLIFDAGMPRRFHWQERYSWTGKQPYDLHILHEEIPLARAWDTILYMDSTLYQWGNAIVDTPSDYVLLFIGNYIDMDEPSKEFLDSFIHQGNDAIFITKQMYLYLNDAEVNLYNTYGVSQYSWINHLYGQSAAYQIPKLPFHINIYIDEGLHAQKLGYIINDETKDTTVNFVNLPHGKGNIFIHSYPILFTNFHLLKGSQDYVSQVLSVTDKKKLVILLNEPLEKKERHMFQWIFDNPALSWAWYIGLLTLITFLCFNAKRKQRIIPVVKPLENTTVQFIQTVGNMYKESGQYAPIVHKRIIYFLDYIRNKYNVDTQSLDDKTTSMIAARSGVPIEQVEEIMHAFNQYRQDTAISKSQFIHFNTLIEQFKKAESLSGS